MIQLSDTIVLDDRDIHERFVRSTGARGQNPNKEATAVELTVDITKSSLPLEVRSRLIALAGRQVTKAGVLRLVSRGNRSQAQNRLDAHARLVALLKRASTPPTARRGTKPLPTTREDRLVSKHRQADIKRLRSGRSDD